MERNKIAIKTLEIMESHRWIPVEERLPKREEWITSDEKGSCLRKIEVAVNSDTIEYFYVYYDGFKWFDKFGRTYANVVAWKIHVPFSYISDI